ncbi:MAG TPA: hypothetical protein VGG02_14980 [Chthoniobacterales bacterium]|jgi:hypothetical protein
MKSFNLIIAAALLFSAAQRLPSRQRDLGNNSEERRLEHGG